MDIILKIHRQQPNQAPQLQRYTLTVQPTTTILDCLNQVKWEQDGSLAFRKNCRNAICGSCAMGVNGRSVLACKENIRSELERLQNSKMLVTEDGLPVLSITPMGNMPVIKDLVVEMQGFWRGLLEVDPIVRSNPIVPPDRELLQTPAQRAQLNPMDQCVLCGACYSQCEAKRIDPQFVGPHALARAYRLVLDSRDDRTPDRLDQYNQISKGVWGCTNAHYCNAACPVGVNPHDQIEFLRQAVLQHQNQNSVRNTSLRVDDLFAADPPTDPTPEPTTCPPSIFLDDLF